MTDTLTETFCERCGTRYEFSAPTRLNPLRKTRGLLGGLKNYLTSQDDLSDAIGDAMRSEEGALATAQLEAFHESFNFCIDCRQYTCINCWNDDAGRCRSCVPIAGTDDLTERFEATYAEAQIVEPAIADDDLRRRLGLEAWPTHDLPVEATNGHATPQESLPVPEPVAEAPSEPDERFVAADGFVHESASQAEAASSELEHERHELDLAATAAAEAAAAEADWEAIAAELAIQQAAAEAEAEPVAAAAVPEERPRLHVVSWEGDAAYDVEVEPLVAEAAPEPELEPVVAEAAPEPEAEPMLAEAAPEPEPEPVVAEAAPEPEAIVPEPAAPVEPRPIAPISETVLHFPPQTTTPPAPVEQIPAVAAQDETPELAARRAQLDLLGLGDPGEGPIVAQPNVLPYRSRGAAVTDAELALRAAAGAQFWEASAREVASAVGGVGIQNCGECGLSLSANARFCRRCGTRQARSA